ncbi:MAG: T9SS type A sorting domain-containing protein, partial [Lewinella sp.]|nr:T9SS type A sorting domain-containing protein [Lewinella sp.]
NSQPGSSGLIAAFEIYPNPNDGRFTFKLVLTLPGNADIWLFRESGQLLEHRSVNGSQTYIEAFDRRGLLPGIYTMVAQAGSDWVFGNFVVN